MARVESDQPLVPSVLDRLLDDDPETRREPPKAQHQVLAELRASVRRDLENLLNTRWRFEEWPVEYEELDRSLVSYGIPDVSAANLGSPEALRKFLAVVERTIRRFEPRFVSVKVRPVEKSSRLDRTMRFRIDAMMHAYPAPEPIVFDSVVEPTTGRFLVERSRR